MLTTTTLVLMQLLEQRGTVGRAEGALPLADDVPLIWQRPPPPFLPICRRESEPGPGSGAQLCKEGLHWGWLCCITTSFSLSSFDRNDCRPRSLTEPQSG